MKQRFRLTFAAALAAAACWLLPVADAAAAVSWTKVYSGLSEPVDIVNAADGTGRLFLVQQTGVVRIVKNGVLQASPFINLSTLILHGGEQGLLGLTFHPQYATNRQFYVNYTRADDGATVIARYTTPVGTPDVADPAAALVLLTIPQPYTNHNGGSVKFGPDGYLYIGMGDGGASNDPDQYAQNKAELLGKILRIDVNSVSAPDNYAIPPTNPFPTGIGGRKEIFAIGLRNPWRISFDRATGDFWIGDVGQNAVEEIDMLPAGTGAGANLGWPVLEGNSCTVSIDPVITCTTPTLTAPVVTYSHSFGCSVTGGFVYRGAAIPSLVGRYLYGDFCSGRLWAAQKNAMSQWIPTELGDTALGVSAFGEDEAGELYVADYNTGDIYKFVDTAITTTTTTLGSSATPSPFGSSLTLTATVTGNAPTGSVNFKEGNNSLPGCGNAVVTSGIASCTIGTLSTGTHSITAAYSGDGSNLASVSGIFTQVISKAVATASLASSANPSVWGQSVTLTASVAGVTPTGTVEFRTGAVAVAGCPAVALTGSGNIRTAVCVTSMMTVTTHNITAIYSGDANNLAATSPVLAQTVNGAVTTTLLTSSANPAAAGSIVTFTATVTGNAPAGTVAFRDGSASLPGCSAVVTSGSGNTRTAQCATSSLMIGGHSITAAYGGNANNAPSTSSVLTQTINGVGGLAQNVALASKGGVASASSTYNGAYPVAALNDNERAGANWGAGGGWNDATAGAYPDFVQINFSAPQTINRVVVFTLQDNFASPVEPGNALTFSIYGVTRFDVQGWTGSAWVTLGSVIGNNLVKRTVTFGAYTTDRIRVNVTGALGGYSRITEVEAWTPGQGVAATSTVLSSSANPSLFGQVVTLTATVTGSAPTGPVNFADGGASLAGCGSVPLSGSGNVRSATCVTGALAVGNHNLTAVYDGDVNNATSTSPVLAQGIAASGAAVNVALASNGGVASASSTFSSAYPVAALNDNERAGVNWGAGGGWNDATGSAYPDWVQVNFSGPQTIDNVVVHTLQDNFPSPVEPTNAQTFSAYGVTDFQVQGWNGSAWVTLGSVSGNNLVKRTVSFAGYTTDRIRINVTGALSGYSRITEVEAWTPGAPPAQNVALAGNGGVASASSAYDANYPVAAVNDNERAGANWGAGGGWNDATAGAYPDWVQIDFSGPQTIDRVIVYTLQDNYGSPVEPTDVQTFAAYGVTDFEVQGWNGASWVTLGSVSGNNLVKRNVNFAAYTTDRIRVNVNGALASYARITEIEAWTP